MAKGLLAMPIKREAQCEAHTRDVLLSMTVFTNTVMAEGLLAMPTKREAQCDAQRRRPTVDDRFYKY